MSPNVDLLRRTLAHIEAHPETWDQQYWASRTPCGTTHCFAGTAVVLAGAPIQLNWYASEHPDEEGYEYASEIVEGPVEYVDKSIYRRAKELLDLEWWDADRLFYGTNDLDDLRRIVGELTADASERAL